MRDLKKSCSCEGIRRTRYQGRFSLGYFSFVRTKKSTLPLEGKTNSKKPLDSRLHGNDGHNKKAAGHDNGCDFDVQDARMSRVHGCTRATFSYLFFLSYKEKVHAAKMRQIVRTDDLHGSMPPQARYREVPSEIKT